MSNNNFSDFNIEPELNSFTGDKLQVDDIINKKIEVIDFIIEDSTKKVGTKRLKIQFKLNEKHHIVFTGSTVLQKQIQKVDKNKFPFFTTIVKESKHLKFT